MKKKLKAYESNTKAISKYARNYLLKNIEKNKNKKKTKNLGNLGNIPSFLISVLSIANFESSDYKNSEKKFRVFELAFFKENLKILNVVSYVKSVKKRFIKQIFWRK